MTDPLDPTLSSTTGAPSPTRLARPRAFYGTLALAALLVWSIFHGRVPGGTDFNVPITYSAGDKSLAVLATIKGFAELPAPFHLRFERLNAPTGADWNDFRVSEKLVYYVAGGFARCFGVGAGANLALLLAQLASALSFGWVARRIAKQPSVAWAAALSFSVCPYLMSGSLGRLPSAFVWHVPLLLYLTVRVARGELPASRAERWGALLLFGLTSLQSPYFTALFWQLLAFATLRSFLRGKRAAARFGLALLGVGIGAFVLNQANVLFRSLGAGANAAAAATDLKPMVTSGLRLPDLFMPVSHVIGPWATYARNHYFNAGNPPSANAQAFLGLVGCILVVALLARALGEGLRRRWQTVPWEAWALVYTVFFAVVGGLDYVVGMLGVTSLHESSIYSIVFTCLSLMWACRAVDVLPGGTRFWVLGALALSFIELAGLRPSVKDSRSLARLVQSDRDFARDLERRLPEGASLCELPLAEFPNGARVQQMDPDEQFRPYLWSETLRISYGAQRGRAPEPWQDGLARLTPRELVVRLRQAHFAAVVVNRNGFANQAEKLTRGLSVAAGPLAESDLRDLAAFDLSAGRTHEARRRISIRFFPQGDDDEPYTTKNGHLVDPDGDIAKLARTSPGTYALTLNFAVQRVLSIQATSQNVVAVDSFVKIFDVLYEGTPALFALRLNHVEGGVLADMAANSHNSIMLTLEVDAP